MGITDEMATKLEKAFSPEHIEIIDESEQHRGHAGYQEGGESHFHITLKAKIFTKMSRLERHRAIHKALGDDIIDRIHALALTVEG